MYWLGPALDKPKGEIDSWFDSALRLRNLVLPVLLCLPTHDQETACRKRYVETWNSTIIAVPKLKHPGFSKAHTCDYRVAAQFGLIVLMPGYAILPRSKEIEEDTIKVCSYSIFNFSLDIT